MHLAAEQFVDRLAERLALDVPQRDFEAGEDADQRGVRPQRVAGAVDQPPQLFEVERVHAGDVALEHVLDHRLDDLRPESVAIDLADAGNAVVGGQLDEDEVAPAPFLRRIADDEHFEVFDFHGAVLGGWSLQATAYA